MAKLLQHRGGTATEHGSFTGSAREVTVDTTNNTLRVHDGSTAGGTRLAKHSEIPDVSSFITGVTAGSGIDVSGTTISVETDLRDGITDIGRDNNDYMNIGTEAFNWYINSGNEMRLEADGDLHVDGDVIAFSTSVSDVALKSDIQMIPNALDKIDEVRGVTFTRHNGQKSAGIIAQELEKVLPCAVREKKLALVDGKKYKTVEYDAIHGLLINCIKELKEEIKELKNGFTK
jgi:hypothetical protein